MQTQAVPALCWPLSLLAHCSPFLPSGDATEETVEQNHAEAFALFLQLTRLPSKSADCNSPTPNSTQHPIVVAACLVGWPGVRSRSYYLVLRTLCDTEGKRGGLGTEDPGPAGREKFDVKLGC